MVKKCLLCKSTVDDRVKLGEFMTAKGITVHYYCLLLTSNLVQNGADHQGILGFLPKDIHNEERRVRQQNCCYCSKPSANLSCCAAKCRRMFHLFCGLENGAVCHFVDDFKTICSIHHPPERKKCKRNDNCVICCESMGNYRKVYSMLTPCCRSGWFHKWCVAEFALNAGYFFKCPLCNNKEVFRSKLIRKGIFVPDSDATWELEPDAFADLLERPDSCSADECKCSKGRTYNKHPHRLLTCNTCGAKCMHTTCMAKSSKTYTCDECTNLLCEIKTTEDQPVQVPAQNETPAQNEAITSDNTDDEIDVVKVKADEESKEISKSFADVTSHSEPIDSLVEVFNHEIRNRKRLIGSDNSSNMPVLSDHSPSSSSKGSLKYHNNNNLADIDDKAKSYELISIFSDSGSDDDINTIFKHTDRRKRKSCFLSSSEESPATTKSISPESDIIARKRKLVNRGSHSLDLFSDDTSYSSSANSDIVIKPKVINRTNKSLDLFSDSDSFSSSSSKSLSRTEPLKDHSTTPVTYNNSIRMRLRNRAKSCCIERSDEITPKIRRSLRLRSIDKSFRTSLHEDILYDNNFLRYGDEKMVKTTPSWENSINLTVQRDLFAYLSHNRKEQLFKDVPAHHDLNETVSSIDSFIENQSPKSRTLSPGTPRRWSTYASRLQQHLDVAGPAIRTSKRCGFNDYENSHKKQKLTQF